MLINTGYSFYTKEGLNFLFENKFYDLVALAIQNRLPKNNEFVNLINLIHEHKQIELLKLLKEKNHLPFPSNSTPLQEVMEKWWKEGIAFYLTVPAVFKNVDHSKRTALQIACQNKLFQEALILLENGVDPNIRFTNGKSACHYFINALPDEYERFLKFNVRLQPDKQGNTPLYYLMGRHNWQWKERVDLTLSKTDLSTLFEKNRKGDCLFATLMAKVHHQDTFKTYLFKPEVIRELHTKHPHLFVKLLSSRKNFCNINCYKLFCTAAKDPIGRIVEDLHLLYTTLGLPSQALDLNGVKEVESYFSKLKLPQNLLQLDPSHLQEVEGKFEEPKDDPSVDYTQWKQYLDRLNYPIIGDKNAEGLAPVYSRNQVENQWELFINRVKSRAPNVAGVPTMAAERERFYQKLECRLRHLLTKVEDPKAEYSYECLHDLTVAIFACGDRWDKDTLHYCKLFAGKLFPDNLNLRGSLQSYRNAIATEIGVMLNEFVPNQPHTVNLVGHRLASRGVRLEGQHDDYYGKNVRQEELESYFDARYHLEGVIAFAEGLLNDPSHTREHIEELDIRLRRAYNEGPIAAGLQKFFSSEDEFLYKLYETYDDVFMKQFDVHGQEFPKDDLGKYLIPEGAKVCTRFKPIAAYFWALNEGVIKVS